MKGIGILRWLLWLALIVPVLALAAAFGALQTGPGRAWLADLIETAASSDDQQIAIGSIEGLVPFDIVVRDLSVADRSGTWLTVDRAALAWSPAALLTGELYVDKVDLGTVAVARQPEPTEAPAEEPSEPFSLPSLPIAVTVERLTIDEVVLAEPVVGTPARFTVDGAARLADPSSGLEARLTVERTDDRPGSLRLALVYLPEEDRVSVDLTVEEPAGGVIAQALALPGAPAVQVDLAGNGTLEAWQATLRAQAGDDARADLDATVRTTDAGTDLNVQGTAAFAALLDSALAPLVDGGVDLSVAATRRPDGSLSIAEAELTARAGTLQLSGTVDPQRQTMDIAVTVTAGSAEAFAALVPGLDWRTLTLDATATGPFLAPDLTADLDGDLSLQQSGEAPIAAVLALSLQAEPTAPLDEPEAALRITADGTVSEPDFGGSAIEALLSPRSSLRLEGQVALDGDVTLSTLDVQTPVGALTASATAEDWGARPDLQAALTVDDLSALTPLTGAEIGGAATIDVTAAQGPDGLSVDLSGSVDSFDGGDPTLNGLLGERVTLAGNVTVEPDGTIDLRDATVTGALLSADAHGTIQDSAVGVDWSASLSDLAAVEPALTGSAEVQGDLSGPLDSLTLSTTITFADLTAAGTALDDARVEAVVRDLDGTPSGDARIVATLEGQPAEITSTFAMQPDGGIRLPDLSVRIASVALDGDLTVAAGGDVTGSIDGSVGSAADLEPWLGTGIDGSGTIDVRLSSRDGQQDVDVTVEARSLTLPGSITVDGAQLNASIADVLATPRLTAELTATDVAAEGTTVETLQARAEGALDDLSLSINASGSAFTLAAEATLAMEEASTRLRLTRLDLDTGGSTMALAGPAVVTFAPEETTVDDLSLIVDSGRISLSGGYGRTLSLTLTLDALPLSLADLAVPDLGLRGQLDGSVNLTGSLGAPSGQADLQITGLQMAGTQAAGVSGVDSRWRLDWRDGRLTVDGSVTPTSDQTLTVTARLPLALDASGAPTVSSSAPVEASLQGTLDLSLFNDFLAAGANYVDGTLDIDLQLGGTFDQLTGAGRLELRNGRYSNVADGVVLNQMAATVEGTTQGLRLTAFSARTPNGGSLSATGDLQLDPDTGMPLDVRVTLNNALVVGSDLLEIIADGNLELQGPLTRQLNLSGAVTLARVEIRIPDRLPSTVTAIQAYEVNVPPELAARRPEPVADEGSGLDIALDVEIAAPRRVFVRGRGLDVELGGTLAVSGTIDTPRVDGTLTLQRGTLDLLGRSLTFSSGTIDFTGDDIDPRFDFTATSQVEDVTAQVTVTGTADAPEIAFSSSPALPEDEVMARLLFGKATGSLSVFEAAQLAASVAQFTGTDTGLGVLDRLRRATGLDRLTIESDDATGEAAVAAGSYLADDVYVGVEQGVETGLSRVTVEIEVTPNITVESGLGSDSSGQVGVNLQWDY